MNFRTWLIKEELWGSGEGTSYNTPTGLPRKVKFPIYKNPSSEEFKKVMSYPMQHRSVGGLLTSDENVYIWPRDIATHYDVQKILGLWTDDYSVAFYIYPDGHLGFSHTGGGKEIKNWREHPRIRPIVPKPEGKEEDYLVSFQ